MFALSNMCIEESMRIISWKIIRIWQNIRKFFIKEHLLVDLFFNSFFFLDEKRIKLSIIP